MELFGARSGRPIDTCLDEVRQSDIVVVIVGSKYGSLVPGEEISFSEAEYTEAQRLSLPCLVYLRSERNPNAQEFMEIDPAKEMRLRRWKETLSERHTVYPFKDSNDLSLQVAADLSREIRLLEKSAYPGTDQNVQHHGGRARHSQPKLLFCQRFGDERRQLLCGLAMDADGSMIIVGGFWGRIDFGGSPLRSTGNNRDIFIAKFDCSGRHKWSKRVGDSEDQVAVGVQVDSRGDIIIASAFEGTLDFGGGPLVSRGRVNVALAKLDSDGRHLWSHSFGEEGYYVPECLGVTSEGSAVIAGRFNGSLDFGCGSISCQSSQTDIFVATMSSDGKSIWARQFGGPYEQQARSIAVDRSGNMAVAGVFKGSISFDGSKLGEERLGEYCGFLTKLDRNGRAIWSKRLGDPSAEQGSVVAFDHANGDIVAAGFIRNKLPPHMSGQVDALCSLSRYDASGILQWSKTFGTCVFPDSVSVSPEGSILLTGHFRSRVDFGLGSLASQGGCDIFAAIFSSDGTPRWSGRFGDAREQFLVQGVHGPKGLVVLAGSFHGTIDFGAGPLVASGYDGVTEGAEDVFLAIFEARGHIL